MAAASTERKRKWDAEARPCEQFQLLRQITSLTKAQCRQILSVVREDGKGSRTVSRSKHLYTEVLPALRVLRTHGKASSEVRLHFLHLPTILEAKAKECGHFRRALSQQRHLTMVFYSDECTPGNVLSPDTTRKSCMVYVTFLHMPLHLEASWMTLSVIRAKDIRRCTGGFPAIVRGLLEQIRADTQDGMVISLDSGPELLFIDRVLVLADHEGMRALSGWKGSSGYRPCFKCANVVSLDGARPASFVDIANSDITRLQPLSHTNLCEIRQELDSLSSTTTKLQEAEKLLGWKFQELSKSFLASPALSGWAELEDCAVDAMHAYWSNGVVAQELGLWYTALLDNSDVNLGHVQTYVKAGWTACPAAGTCMSNVWSYFSENLWRKNQDFRGDAKACLFALPFCVQFGEEILRGNILSMDAVLDSLMALNRVCMCILRSKADVSHSTNLLGLQADHMRRFDLAHGRQHRPKMHFGLHLREQCTRWQRLVDCFTCERKHRAFKHVASNVRKITQFSKSCLLEMATGDIRTDVASSDATLKGAVDCPDLAALLSCSTSPKLAKTVCIDGLTAKSGDYFVLSPELAVLVCGALAVSAQSKALQPETLLLVEPLIAASINRNARDDGCTEWHPSDKPLALLDVANLSRVHQVFFARQTRNADGQLVVSLLH